MNCLGFPDRKWKSTKISLAIQNDNFKTVNPSALAGTACQTRFDNPSFIPTAPENSEIVITELTVGQAPLTGVNYLFLFLTNSNSGQTDNER